MADNKPTQVRVPEIAALDATYNALKDLEQTSQLRVLRWTAELLGINGDAWSEPQSAPAYDDSGDEPTIQSAAVENGEPADDLEGISPVALKWMKRSGLTQQALQPLFSLGIDDIDLVANKVPGKSIRERMHSVLLLKAIASYLGTGVPRVTYEQLKEACLHYKAYDGTNFATYMKAFAPEVSGSKKAGFTLTPRGITTATEMVKDMLKGAAQ